MRTRIAFVASFVITLLVGSLVVGFAQTPPTLDERMAAVETHQAYHHGLHVAAGVTHPNQAAPAATNTPAPGAAATNTPAPPVTASGWHPPGAHDGLNVHEHGTAPPAWVNASGNPAFTQTREAHTGYKGVLDTSPGGAQSYFIGHIFSTEFARSHGDHDYQLWLRDPETNQVSFVQGILSFNQNASIPTSAIPERTNDTGERPIALSVGDGSCETWYNLPGAQPMDVGWTMCGRYEKFSGQVTGGVGTFRTIDWVIPCSRLPANHVLQDNCRVEFGLRRLSFLANNVEHDPQHITRPIN